MLLTPANDLLASLEQVNINIPDRNSDKEFAGISPALHLTISYILLHPRNSWSSLRLRDSQIELQHSPGIIAT